jgi:hypothetical protein
LEPLITTSVANCLNPVSPTNVGPIHKIQRLLVHTHVDIDKNFLISLNSVFWQLKWRRGRLILV